MKKPPGGGWGNGMVGLVEEIQRDALNPDVAVSTILRKVKVAAAKLALPRVEDWVENELNGFTGELPEYRKLRGRPNALNPYNGWIPIIMNSDRENDLLSQCEIRQSVSSIEDLIQRSSAGFIEMQFPPAVIRALNAGADVEFGRMSNHLAVSQVQAIVDHVRNLALDWAIDLERTGVLGEGYSFNDLDRQKAHSSGMTVNIGSVGNFAGNLGHGNTARDITAHQNDSLVFSELSAALSRAVSDAEERQGLMERIAEMEAAKSDRGAFAVAYGRFMSAAANHMAIVAPFIPALSAFLSG